MEIASLNASLRGPPLPSSRSMAHAPPLSACVWGVGCSSLSFFFFGEPGVAPPKPRRPPPLLTTTTSGRPGLPAPAAASCAFMNRAEARGAMANGGMRRYQLIFRDKKFWPFLPTLNPFSPPSDPHARCGQIPKGKELCRIIKRRLNIGWQFGEVFMHEDLRVRRSKFTT